MRYFLVDENYNVVLALIDGEVWLREGECKQCGKCCVALHPENAGADGMCKYLVDNKCSLHDSAKPPHCRMSPMLPKLHDHIPECGYRWSKVK